MSENKEELIDLNKLTQRELLILNHKKLEETANEVAEIKKQQQSMSLKVNTLETKSKMWGGFTGFISGLLSGFLTR